MAPDPLLVAARSALLDALDALAAQRGALVLIGAQAIYLHTGEAPIALAESTKDSDLAVDPRELADTPEIAQAMRDAGFYLNVQAPNPGSWLSPTGIPVDLMVPERFAGPSASNRRGARIPPHDKSATRRADGLEATIVDFAPQVITALDPADKRAIELNVAGPAALLIAKLHKIGERQAAPRRLVDKDAHDVYRLLVAIETDVLAERLSALREDAVAAAATIAAITYLKKLFGPAGAGLGSEMAGRAEQLVGDPETVRRAVTALADDLLDAL